MRSLKNLLESADPLRHESPHLDGERERIRTTILQTRPTGRRAPARRRFGAAGVLAVMVMSVALLGYQLSRHGTAPLLAAVRFEVRLAEEQPLPGLRVAQVAGSDRVIYLHPEVVVGNDDVAQSWVSQGGPDRFEVVVALLPSGAERMRRATEEHLGRPVAVLIDGRVVMAPVVRSPIAESAVISASFTQAEAARIAEGIGRR